MLLFVLACGLSVTLGLMNFINLAHGAFAMAGGYITVVLVNRLGVPFFAAPAARLPRQRRCSARCSSARSTSTSTRKPPSRPGAVHHRPRLHVGGGGRLRHGLERSIFVQIADLRCRARFDVVGVGIGRYRLLIIVVCGAADDRAAARSSPSTRFGSRLRAAVDDPRVARGLGINVNGVFAAHLRVRLRPRRPRRRARRRDPRPRSDLPAQIHDLLPDRGDGRRHLEHHRAVPRLAPARHRRRRRQVLRAHARLLRHLHHHDRRADLAAAGTVRPRRVRGEARMRRRRCQPTSPPRWLPPARAGSRWRSRSGCVALPRSGCFPAAT